MMEISKCMKIPKIRFKGFEEEWNIAKIKEIAKFSKGNGYSKADLTQQGTPIILYGHMYTQYKSVITSVNHYVKIKPNSVLSDGNEVIIPSAGETPEAISIASAICKSNIIIGGDLNIFRFNDEILNKSFAAISISYSKTHKELSRYAQGKTIVHLRNNDIAKGHITYPSLNEQRLIVLFIETIETQIQATSKKLASLKQIKAANLQSMFPQEGETVPKVRFKGFEEEWKYEILGKISSISIGEFVIQTKQRANAPYPVYNGGITNTGYYDYFNQEGPKIIISARGANAGFISKYENRFWAGNSCYSIGINNNNWEFIYYFLQSKQDSYLKEQQAANIPSISKKQIYTTNVLLPCYNEQIKIGLFFSNLDKQISLQTQRLEKLKQIKAACLDKMFV